jgi:uncharacterized protein (DUF1330 family)
MSKAYVIGELHVHDPETLKAYRDKVLETVEAFGGRFLARAGDPVLPEGDEPLGLPVILEFNSQADAKAWWNSPQYKAIHGVRLRSTVSRIILVNGSAVETINQTSNAPDFCTKKSMLLQ